MTAKGASVQGEINASSGIIEGSLTVNGNIILSETGQIIGGADGGSNGNWKMTKNTLSNGNTRIESDGDIFLNHTNGRLVLGNCCSIMSGIDQNQKYGSGPIYLRATDVIWLNGDSDGTGTSLAKPVAVFGE